MTQIFDRFSILDPKRAEDQVEAALGKSVFDRFSILDPERARAQVEAGAGKTIFDKFSALDPALAERQVEAAIGGGGGYVPKALRFGPTTFLDIASLAASDSPYFTLATFFRTTQEAVSASASGSLLGLIDFYPAGDEDVVSLSFGSNGPGVLANVGALFDDNPDNGQALALIQVPPSTGYVAFDGNYHSFVFSFDASVEGTGKLAAAYLDRVLIGSGNSVNKPAFSFKFNGAEVGVPDTTSDYNPLAVVDLGGYYLAFPGVKIVQNDNTILEADLNNFVTVDNKPVDPAVPIAIYGTPAIWVKCDASDLTNYGTGGALIVTGTPTDTDAP